MTNSFTRVKRDLRICWDRQSCVFVQSLNSKLSKHKCFWYSWVTHKPLPPLCAGPIQSCKFQQVCPIAGSDVPPLAEAPLTNLFPAMTNLLHKHPEPITINPTPGNTPQPQVCTKTSFSITGKKVTAQQISPFFLLRAAGH